MDLECFRSAFSIGLLGDDPDWLYDAPALAATGLVIYSLRGGEHRSRWTVDGAAYDLCRERLLLAPPATSKKGAGNGSFCAMALSADTYREALAFADEQVPAGPLLLKATGTHSFYLDYQFSVALRLYLDRPPLWELEAMLRAGNVLARAFEIYLRSGITDLPEFCRPEHSVEHRINRLVDYLSTHLDRQPGVPEMAERCLMSEATFYRKFHRITGFSPHQFLLRLRISRAREILNGTDTPIAAAAHESGFQSLQSFHHTFKAHTGVSPSEFRARREAQSAERR